MTQTIEAIVDKSGKVSLLTPVRLPATRRALLTILDEEPKAATDAQKERLRSIFGKMREQVMFQGIENPTEWQKNLRNEW